MSRIPKPDSEEYNVGRFLEHRTKRTKLCFLKSFHYCAPFLGISLVAQTVKHLPAMQETWVRSLGQEDPLEKKMATHSSILAWKIPWTEEPGRLESMGSQRVGHDWATSLHFTSLFPMLKWMLAEMTVRLKAWCPFLPQLGPENTIMSFEKAVEYGAHGLESDVQIR